MSRTLIDEIYQLQEILNILLVVSDLRKNTDISEQIRIDEMILDIIKRVSDKHFDYKECINFTINISPENTRLLQINIDKTQIFIALFNLIENAVKFSQGKTVQIHLYEIKREIHVVIQDKGIGIPEKQIKEISRPFYRADNAEKVSGTGIGLSIALRILEKNFIKYTIESNINKGTVITLIFMNS